MACDGFGSRIKRGDDNAPDARWVCSVNLQSDGCSCEKLKPGWESSGSDTIQCLAYDCCLLNETESESSTATCLCREGVPNCQAEASSLPDTRVVSQCPPSAEAPQQACAQPSENCRKDYLEQQQLVGCCEGTVCEANESGVPVCREASAKEVELSRQCDKAAHASVSSEQPLADGSLTTSAGTLQFGTWRPVLTQTGPGGCLRGFSALLVAADGSCSLHLGVNVQNNRLVVDSIVGFLATCPGFSGPLLEAAVSADGAAAQAAVDFSFEGLACGGHLIVDSYCVAGRFDFHFHGKVDELSFGDDHVIAEAVMCGAGEPQGSCPQP